MNLSEYIVPTFVGGLSSLEGLLNKGAEHVETTNVKPEAVLGATLFPDMFPLSKQVFMATDLARRGLERLLGMEVSSTEKNQSTFDELKSLVQNTKMPWESCNTKDLNTYSKNIVKVPIGKGKSKEMSAEHYATLFLAPNLYFHVTTIYNILRHVGVPLGKKDFLSPLLSQRN